jgi:hypothetical protein
MLYARYHRQPVLSLYWFLCTRPTTAQIEMEEQACGATLKTSLIFRVAAPSRFSKGLRVWAEHGKKWCGWGDSNARPRASEARALSS